MPLAWSLLLWPPRRDLQVVCVLWKRQSTGCCQRGRLVVGTTSLRKNYALQSRLSVPTWTVDVFHKFCLKHTFFHSFFFPSLLHFLPQFLFSASSVPWSTLSLFKLIQRLSNMMYCNAKLLQSGTNSSITSDILLPSILLKLLNKHSFSVNKICDLSFKVGDMGL